MRRQLYRWWYLLKTFRDHAARLNRSVDVENVLLRAAALGISITPDECRKLALRLGTPEQLRR